MTGFDSFDLGGFEAAKRTERRAKAKDTYPPVRSGPYLMAKFRATGA